ncbi:hypothetical protein IGL98_000387 [Enterococcus sp. DIV0840]|uniref:hypothetical protein n=1 Tax=Enterococcus TaxID=1350 RepID=UPI001A8C64A2|nr:MULTISPECIES: hypothetical protein [Enterococcus]MBO0435652.1 hypothetical protein [Enterococcus sp. DIV0849a]MBO0475160.1 hypothetical protein [Enterococcus ureasiticus]
MKQILLEDKLKKFRPETEIFIEFADNYGSLRKGSTEHFLKNLNSEELNSLCVEQRDFQETTRFKDRKTIHYLFCQNTNF